MSTLQNAIQVEAIVNAPIERVWECWNKPEHITKWCQASDDWHAPFSENDLREGGNFKTTMAAKDGSFEFDFGGTYTAVKEHQHIAYSMEDGRKVTVDFSATDDGVKVVECFEPEAINPREMQHAGWQAILDSFRKYTESGA